MALSLMIVIRRGGVSKVKPDMSVLRGIVISGLPYAVVVFAMTIYWRTDTVLIERLLPGGAREAGNYAQAFRLFDAFAMIPVMFGGLLLPILSRELAAGNDVRALAVTAARALLPPLGIAAVTMATFSQEILDLLYRSPAPSAVDAFTLLMFTLVPAGVTYVFSTMLTAAGLMKRLAMITLAAMVVTVIMNLFLIPEYSAAGAALSALVTQSLVAAACVIEVRKSMFSMVVPAKVSLFLAMLLLTFAAGQLMRHFDMPWGLAAALQLITGFICALVFRMIEPLQSIKLILTKR
jgi:O-antigen/teichoic acid export membrane protein